jgi:hypothetical protein
MPKKVIPVGDGRTAEITVGELFAPPPAPPVSNKGVRAGLRKKATSKHYTYKGTKPFPTLANGSKEMNRRREVVPGYAEWLRERMREIQQFFNKPGGPTRKRGGVPDGMRREEAEAIWAEARRRARIDMDNIKKVDPDIDERAEEAMLSTLEVMRSPMNQQIKLAAARQVLEWTKAKPAAKQEVTVNAAEAWLAKIAEDAED